MKFGSSLRRKKKGIQKTQMLNLSFLPANNAIQFWPSFHPVSKTAITNRTRAEGCSL